MSEVKWTPGPWKAVTPKSGMVHVMSDNRDDVAMLHYVTLGMGEIVPLGPASANAHLISAAPDMYEALTYILSDVEPTEFALSETARAKAQRALAKARG